MLVIRKIHSSYIESRREGVVCCQEVSHVFQGEGVWKVFVVMELHLSYRKRRIVGVCDKGATLLLQG